MNWLQRYRAGHYVRNALWIPFLRDQHYQKISDELYVHP